MRPPEEVRRDLVRQWLGRAEEDLGVAEHLLKGGAPYLASVAFHAQQAAEKFLKARLVHHQVPFPKTHDLARLLDLLRTVAGPLADWQQQRWALPPAFRWRALPWPGIVNRQAWIAGGREALPLAEELMDFGPQKEAGSFRTVLSYLRGRSSLGDAKWRMNCFCGY